jgi:hypothetical protein
MSRIVLNSANTAVLIGDSPSFKTSDETGVLFAGVQTVSFSLPQTRQTQKQVGSSAYAVNDLVRHPDINLQLSYLYSPSMANEEAMGLTIYPDFEYGIAPPTTDDNSFLSGIEDKSYNFYIYNHPNQNFDAIKYLKNASSNSPNNGEIISFGNAYLTDYSMSFADGGLPTVSTTFKCSNMKAENYSADIESPAINLVSGNNINVGNLDVSETKIEKEDFYGLGVGLDLSDPKTQQPGDFVLELENLQVGGQNIGGSDHMIKSMSINIPITRVDLHGLGSDYVRERKMQYPSRGNLTLSSLVSKYQTGFVSGLLRNESAYDFTVTAKSCDQEVECEFGFSGLKLETFSYSVNVNEEMQYEASFSFYMGDK